MYDRGYEDQDKLDFRQCVLDPLGEWGVRRCNRFKGQRKEVKMAAGALAGEVQIEHNRRCHRIGFLNRPLSGTSALILLAILSTMFRAKNPSAKMISFKAA